MTADRAFFNIRDETLFRKVLCCADDLTGREHFDSQVIDRASDVRILEENQFERWISDCEVGISRSDLHWFSLEELRIENHRLVKVRDVKGKLNSRHCFLP